MFCVSWRDFDKYDRLVLREKWFKTADERAFFVNDLVRRPNFYESVSWTN